MDVPYRGPSLAEWEVRLYAWRNPWWSGPLHGKSPNTVKRPFVATKTFPFATSGAAHLAA